MKLTDKQIKAASPAEKPYKMSDGRGLYLLVNPNGSKYWRLKYRFQGKEQKLALGIYPEISLKQARTQSDEARQHLSNGINPSSLKKTTAAANKTAYENSFENVAKEWLEVHAGSVTPLHIKKITSLLTRFIYPEIGAYPITDIDTPTVLEALRKIESSGRLETMQRAKRTTGQIFTFAIASGKATINPVLPLARGVLKTPKASHRAAVTTPKELGRLMALIHNYREIGTIVVEAALKCSALWMLRQGELRFLEWHQVNWEEKRLELTASKTKQPHVVPLARQSLEILEELHQITGHQQFIFQSPFKSSVPISENATVDALRRLGVSSEEHCAHGFRATFRTLMDEIHRVRIEIVELQLAHVVKDVHGRAYNRTQFIDDRFQMMQRWADYLDQLRTQSQAKNVITANFKRKA